MYAENPLLKVKDSSDMERYLVANFRKITSSRSLLALLKEYLDEPDLQKRQSLAARILSGIGGDKK